MEETYRQKKKIFERVQARVEKALWGNLRNFNKCMMNGFERLNERDKKMDLPGIERSPKYPNALTSASVSQMAKHTHIRFYTRCRAGLNVRLPNGKARSHPLLHTMQGRAECPYPKWPGTLTSAFTHDAGQSAEKKILANATNPCLGRMWQKA